MRLKLWAAFAATSLVGISVIATPEARADRFGNAEETGRKNADKSSKDSKSGKDKEAQEAFAESVRLRDQAMQLMQKKKAAAAPAPS